MATLRKLQINEVSLVLKGANPHARIAMFKRHTGDEPNSPPVTSVERQATDQAKVVSMEQERQIVAPVDPRKTWDDPSISKQAIARIWNAEVETYRKSAAEHGGSITGSEAIDQYCRTPIGKTLWDALKDPARPQFDGDPVPTRGVAKFMPASTKMQELADQHLAGAVAIGKRMSPEQAYTAVYADPINAALMLAVKAEERRR